MIERAQQDMRSGHGAMEAVAWLASKNAAVYFDILDIPQSSFCRRTDWWDYAQGILEHDLAEMKEWRVIDDTIYYLENL